MYTKDLSETVRLRLTVEDMQFLKDLAEQRQSSISSCIRSIVGEYRRSVTELQLLQKALTQIGAVQDGDTSTNFHNIL